jgi:dTDP-4-amino-4,6-dideoxygalactose transaminase
MPENEISRREFLKQNSIAGMGLVASGISPSVFSNTNANMPAILGGKPAVDTSWIKWPMWIPETDEKMVLEVLRSGVWSRDNVVTEFETQWANTVGMKRCVATVNGTNAMITSLVQLDVGGGDEVIIPGYTFIATALAVLATGAMPVFVDTDPETFQIDSDKIESKITSRTRAILPVHLAGLPADVVRIMAIAKKHNLVVVEDACQAHLAEVDHKKAGSFGHAGCFSFQNSKNLPIGEGGAIVSNDEAFMDKCYAYHNFGQAYGSVSGKGPVINGSKLRLTEYQAAVGLVQLKRLEEQSKTRSANAAYLKAQLEKIPGILPYKLYENVTRAAYHFFPFRYKKEAFKELPRSAFLDALNAEGVPCFSGYGTLSDKPYLEDAFRSKNFRKMHPAKVLDIKRYLAANECPETRRLCNEESVWFEQSLLLSEKKDMDGIVAAIEKIRNNADAIKKNTLQ